MFGDLGRCIHCVTNPVEGEKNSELGPSHQWKKMEELVLVTLGKQKVVTPKNVLVSFQTKSCTKWVNI